MSAIARMPLARRPDLIIRPSGDDGQHVIKDPSTGAFYSFGEQESFLLMLDGSHPVEAIFTAFGERFGEPLSEEDLHGFLGVVQDQGLLRPSHEPGAGETATSATPCGASWDHRPPTAPDRPSPPPRRPRLSLLAWRKSLYDPDRLFNRLEPGLRFVWSGPFLAVSAACIGLAIFVAWANRQELVSSFAGALRWETLLLVWFTLLVATILHEFAHGLTCKHYGGEVHEVGFLMLFFIPCFYCNVSDAWLFREKAKRLWVTLAGAYCDLCLWSLAVFAWRATVQDSVLNYLAWVVVTVCGFRVLMNFNPFLKLDGYYLLGDLVGIPNLRQGALGAVMGHMRHLLWGAQRPARQPRGRFLAAYGVVTWLFSLGFLTFMVVGLVRLLEPADRWMGLLGGSLLGTMTLRELFQGVSAGEVDRMIRMRHKRTTIWVLLLGAVPGIFTLGQIEDSAKGQFQVRPVTGAELRAPVAGFLRAVHLVEGDRVSPGSQVARLEVPDLDSRLARKRAEVREARAGLRMLEDGVRREESHAQRQRVERARAWWELARRDLERVQSSLKEQLARLDAQISQYRAEYDYAAGSFNRAKLLLNRKSISTEQFQDADRGRRVAWNQLKQAEAEKLARQADGAREAEQELVRREQALAEAQAALDLLEAGARDGEIEAARARLSLLEEEVSYLESVREKLLITSPVAGLVTTPRLREKIGQFFREGELIGEVKDGSIFEAEITLPEQSVAHVRPGQRVELKARGVPFRTFTTRVERIAPSAEYAEGKVQSTVTIYCRLEDAGPDLRPGMTGYGRIACGRRPVGEILVERVQGFLRTEFWW